MEFYTYHYKYEHTIYLIPSIGICFKCPSHGTNYLTIEINFLKTYFEVTVYWEK